MFTNILPKKFCLLPLFALLSLGFLSGLSAQETGTLTGRIVFDGDAPEAELVVKKGATVKDAEFCAAEDLYDNTLLVNPENNGVANVIVYIKPRDAKKLEIPEAVKESKEKELVFDQKNCRFTPHVMVVRSDQAVRVLSDDGCAHNTHTYPIKNDAVNISIKANDREGVLLDKMTIGEIVPTTVKCDIHPHMTAYWMITQNPWATVTDENGNFKIENLPADEKLTFAVWHERGGYLEKKLRTKVKAGETEELGDMKYKASKFEKK